MIQPLNPIAVALAKRGALSSADLYALVANQFGSQRSFERAISDTPNLFRLGSRRSRGYALARREMKPVPIYICDETGVENFLAELVALEAGQWAWDAWNGDYFVWMMLGELGRNLEVYQGLPWCMDAFRPAGFLGRAWVREHAKEHGWSLDIRSWTDDQVLNAARQVPWDWRGNLSIGPFTEAPNHYIPRARRREEYARRADLAMDGIMVGASADGEQPKFTAVVDEDGIYRPVLVKFSPRISNDPAARRWSDVMVTEGVAQQVMAIHGLDSAVTEMWVHDDRLWLETTRFDRVGARGRRGMASLRAMAKTFRYYGPEHGWVLAMEHLLRSGVVQAEDVELTKHLATIGHLLLNTDMHMGNLSFVVTKDARHPLKIAPVYDMTPMRWAPAGASNTAPQLMEEPVFKTKDRAAMVIAAEIWEETSRRDVASDEWRQWSLHRAKQIRAALEA